MNFAEFDKKIKEMAMKSKDKMGLSLSQKVSVDALRFVDDNFRSQSWEGTQWAKSSEDGTTLVASGALKRGFNDEQKPGQVRIYNNVKYARVHNEGFSGSQSVNAHKRAVYQKLGKGKKKKVSTGEVRAFTRNMNIKQRQFAPMEGSESPTLNATVRETIIEHVNELLNVK